MAQAFWYSFPVQLLLLHGKKNQWLLGCWLVLFGFVAGNWGRLFGVPYLFLDPEYNQQVSFWGLLIMGVGVGGFTMAFHITCYILDAHRFSFLGNEKNPFTKFCINNSLLPLVFLVTYLIGFVRFQLENEFANATNIIWQATGLITGFVLIVLLLSLYFTGTNKDIFKILASGVNAPFRQRHKITRVNVMRKVDSIRQSRIRIDYFFDPWFRVKKADVQLMDLNAALKVLRQNHQNAFIIQCFVFITVIGLGIFREKTGISDTCRGQYLITVYVADDVCRGYYVLAARLVAYGPGWRRTAA